MVGQKDIVVESIDPNFQGIIRTIATHWFFVVTAIFYGLYCLVVFVYYLVIEPLQSGWYVLWVIGGGGVSTLVSCVLVFAMRKMKSRWWVTYKGVCVCIAYGIAFFAMVHWLGDRLDSVGFWGAVVTVLGSTVVAWHIQKRVLGSKR